MNELSSYRENEEPKLLGEYVLCDDIVIKAYGDKSNPIFHAKSLSQILGYKDPYSMMSTVDPKYKKLLMKKTQFGSHSSWFISSNGLANLIFSGRREKSKKYKDIIVEFINKVKHGE
jgi:hypothetical protein